VSRLAVSIAAKVNLHLDIVGRRSDGYHDIRTLFQSVDLYDRVRVEAAPNGVLELRVEPHGAVESGDGNTVLRAARAMQAFTGRPIGARFELIKRIPVGSGLGGGAADAAATLVLLDRLHGLGLDRATMLGIAAELGSDVPFFLSGGLALGVGRGDEIRELPDLDAYPVVIAAPRLVLETADVFRRMRVRLTSDRPTGTLDALVAGLPERPDWRAMTNALEETVVGGWPEIGDGLRMLRCAAPLHAGLTGTGSAGFAVFSDSGAAHRAAAGCPAGWFTHVGRMLPRRTARPAVVRVCDGGQR
jgi:4-diphosphocytidyl-2-C-methyl-D-erythritol kinase